MLDERALSLRVELKTWEKQFAAENGGRRPGRDDIRSDAAIAAKYREYDKSRRPAKKSESQDDKAAKIHTTPRKKAAPAATPQKANSQFLLPSLPVEQQDDEVEPTPAAVRMYLGPTPQKDGHILSLFDDLPSTKRKTTRKALATIEANVSATPSKLSQPNFGQAESSPPENLHLNHTPASSSKRFLLDSFVSTTPLKRKREDEDGAAHATPSSSAKGLSTPAFLRRSSNMLIMDTLAEEAEDDEEIKSLDMGRMRQPAFKKRGIVRSLSSIIQGLRKQEDDKLDEELDIMREMEEEDDPKSAVQVEDSQVVMPLGPDRAVESDEEEEDQEGVPFRKPWKKKGLKRQTKRTNMRPAPKPKPPPTEQPSPKPEEEIAVAETQLVNPDEDGDSGSDAGYSDSEAKRKRQTTKTVPENPKNETVVKKAAKKISATAHANFRRLNIKNQNSKAKGKGRFGRR